MALGLGVRFGRFDATVGRIESILLALVEGLAAWPSGALVRGVASRGVRAAPLGKYSGASRS